MTAFGKTDDSTEEHSEIEVTQDQAKVQDETSVVEDISKLSEQLNIDETSASLKDANEEIIADQYEEQIQEISDNEDTAVQNIETASESAENVEKAAEAANEAMDNAEDVTSSAGDVASEINNQTSQTKQEAEKATEIVADSRTTKEEAKTIIADTEKSIDSAKAGYEQAQVKYNDTFNEYEQAKSDYQTALKAYNVNKAIASKSMDEAAQAFDLAQEKLNKLKGDLQKAREELSAAGADALIASEDNKSENTKDYVATVLQYYYIPQAEKLSEGQIISDFKVVPSDKDSSVMQVTYNIMDSDNNVLRTVTADYGYDINSEDGQVELFTKDLVYEYTNTDGSVVNISKEEAEKLNGKIEIDNYWTVSGYYVPTYVDNYRYEGTRSAITYTKDSAMLAGKRYVVDMYHDPNKFYKQAIIYNPDWKVDFYLIPFEYVTTGSFSARYNKVADKGGYAISSDVSSAHYTSEEDAYNAAFDIATKQAQNEQGAAYIDKTESKFNTNNVIEYADIVDKYVNNGDAVWKSASSGYVSYMDIIRSKVKAYKELIDQVSQAMEEYQNAQSKTEEIKGKIEALDGNSDVISVAKLAQLELTLNKAQRNLDEAKENLDEAQKSLDILKKTYNNRFTAVKVSNTRDYTVDDQVLEEILVKESKLEDIKKVQEKKTPKKIAVNTVVNPGVSNEDDNVEENHYSEMPGEYNNEPVEEVVPEEQNAPQQVIIPDEEVPLAITADGILQHAKWFVGLAGVSAAGAGVALAEAKRRAAAKIIDKLNL